MDLEVLANKSTDWFNMVCPICGKRFHIKQSSIPRAKNHYCSKQCHNIAKKEYASGSGNHQYGLKGKRNSSWKGGRKLTRYGYWTVQCIGHPFAVKPGEYVLEHRLVAEKYLLTPENSVIINGKSYLSPNFIVHHKNGNRLDNRPENLLVMKKADHSKLHSTENVKKMERSSDGRFISSMQLG